MSKVQQILEIAKRELDETPDDKITKTELGGLLDTLLENVPQAEQMDEQQLDIMIAYMNHLSAKMDLLFNATSLVGIGLSNDLKVRATIKQMNDKFEALQQGLERRLNQIIDPDFDKKAAANNEKVNKAIKDAGTKIITS